MSNPNSTHHSSEDFLLPRDVGFAFLKPGYSGIIDDFVVDLGHFGLQVPHVRDIVLPRAIIDYVYSDSRGEDFYEVMQRKLASTAVRALIVYQETNNGVMTVQHKLESLKRGTGGYPNLRAKYQREEHVVKDDEFSRWLSIGKDDPSYSDLAIRLTQKNVMHASDGPHDAIGTLLRLRSIGRQFPDTPVGGFFDAGPNTNRIVIRGIVRALDKILERHYRERDMSKVIREWRVIEGPEDIDPNYEIRQVYMWLLTSDGEVVVVSKDGENWQLPGGKPDPKDTSITDTIIREVYEETGINIFQIKDAVEFFGQYYVEDRHGSTVVGEKYLQIRTWLKVDKSSKDLCLNTSGESEAQRPEDTVRFVKSIPLNEIGNIIPWIPNTDEFKALRRKKIIKIDPI